MIIKGPNPIKIPWSEYRMLLLSRNNGVACQIASLPDYFYQVIDWAERDPNKELFKAAQRFPGRKIILVSPVRQRDLPSHKYLLILEKTLEEVTTDRLIGEDHG
jgi:hypothetical protein